MPDNNNGSRSTMDPVSSCPYEQPAHWVEIQLEDQNGRAVPNEEFLVVLPDGKEVRGYLDSAGWARVEAIDSAGECLVSFPNLDSAIWEFDHSTGPA